jgi:hypothetical protein
MQVKEIVDTESVIIQTESKSFQRTLDEIDRLYQYLVSEQPQLVIPPVVKSRDREYLKKEIQLFLSRVWGHAVLRDTQGVKDFVDSKFQFVYSPSLRKSRSLFSFSTQDKSLFSFSSQHVQDIDVFFDDARSETSQFMVSLGVIGKSNERMAGIQTAIVENISLVASRYLALPQSDPQFNRIVRKLVKTHDAEEEFTSTNVFLSY